MTGAEDALVVNNCAAAVLLVLDTFAKGREVVVARSQLVEIGGGFRVPEVLERSGATLVEVGTTNRVYVEDFERALSPRTALVLRTHASNYRVEGFTHEPGAQELGGAWPARRRSGRRRSGQRRARRSRRSTASRTNARFGRRCATATALVTFSGDKLLGGPQAGIVAGRAPLVARLRNNPLLRALRVGKTHACRARCDAASLIAQAARASDCRSIACWRRRYRAAGARRDVSCARLRARRSWRAMHTPAAERFRESTSLRLRWL